MIFSVLAFDSFSLNIEKEHFKNIHNSYIYYSYQADTNKVDGLKETTVHENWKEKTCLKLATKGIRAVDFGKLVQIYESFLF